MTRKKELVVNLIAALSCIVIALYFILQTDVLIEEGLPAVISPRVFPTFILGVVLLSSLVYLAETIFAWCRALRSKVNMSRPVAADADSDGEEEASPLGLYAYIGILFMYYFFLEPVGFIIITPFVMFAVARLLGNRKVVMPLLAYSIFAVTLHQLFLRTMQLALPNGILSV